MEDFDRKKHWENIYQNKLLTEVSWYQPVPETSINFIRNFEVPKDAKIIDIGGGDSFLPDFLLEMGYENINVLDISANAIERAKGRLGEHAEKINWIVSDVVDFTATEQYDLWHDRASFHFLTSDPEVKKYVELVSACIKPGGLLIIGTFSEQGPKKCSGIDIRQYSESTLEALFEENFDKVNCLIVDHPTPFGTKQNFIFCSFRRKLKYS